MAETRKLNVEIEIPSWLPPEEAERAARSGAKRAVLYLILEKSQEREPTERELEELAREAKRNIYRRIREEP